MKVLPGPLKAAQVVLLCVAAATGGCYDDAEQYHQLVLHQRTIEGHISSRDCSDHYKVYYGFEVNGERYGGLVPAGMADCKTVAIGQSVTVYYDPSHPGVHTLMDPQVLYDQERGYYIPAWVVIFGGIISMMVLRTVSWVRGAQSASDGNPPEK